MFKKFAAQIFRKEALLGPATGAHQIKHTRFVSTGSTSGGDIFFRVQKCFERQGGHPVRIQSTLQKMHNNGRHLAGNKFDRSYIKHDHSSWDERLKNQHLQKYFDTSTPVTPAVRGRWPSPNQTSLTRGCQAAGFRECKPLTLSTML